MKSKADVKEIKELARCIVEANKVKLEELDDPLDCYAQEMKMRWHQDVKLFSKRLIDGYDALLDQLGRKDLP